MKTLIVIPSRFQSSRFEGKPLADIDGKSMVQRVYDQAGKCREADKCIVATDDKRIADHVSDFGGNVEMTSPDHQSGTDRCAEVAERFPEYDIIVNVQGDEPFIDPNQIDELILFLKNERNIQIATQKKKIVNSDELFSPNTVKVVSNENQQALYFSRAPIPYFRGLKGDEWCKNCDYFKHIGLYAFTRKKLMEIKDLPISCLEKTESLEQLRWLENGHAIGVIETTYPSIGIDTPEDLERIKPFLKSVDS
jgi:3-deoxy-manno-octulosonate cytidylyltransferase (CMP-KDO synthetase)